MNLNYQDPLEEKDQGRGVFKSLCGTHDNSYLGRPGKYDTVYRLRARLNSDLL